MRKIFILLFLFINTVVFGQVWNASWSKVEPHAFMEFNDSAVTIALTDDNWAVVTNSYSNLFTVHDNSAMTIAGDTITYQVSGDYVIDVSFSFSATSTGKNWELGIFKNGQLYRTHSERRTSSVDIGSMSVHLYSDGVVGDDLSLRVRNTTNDDDIVVNSCQWLIYRLHP
jgi:hypothetical protein